MQADSVRSMDEGLLVSFRSIEDRHWWFVARRRIVLEALDRAGCNGSGVLLDVGCGTGGFLRGARASFNGTVRGIEPSSKAAEVAALAGLDVTVGDFSRLPEESDAIETLVALDVLEHCEDDVEALREAYRVLRPGGLLVLTVPALQALWSSHDDDNGHYRRYTRRGLSRVLQESGFVPMRATYFNTLLLPLGASVRVVSRITGKGGSAGLGMPPRFVNAMLTQVFDSERLLMRRWDLPVGMSLLAVGRKPSAQQELPGAAGT